MQQGWFSVLENYREALQERRRCEALRQQLLRMFTVGNITPAKRPNISIFQEVKVNRDHLN
jgi:hypothetical protein